MKISEVTVLENQNIQPIKPESIIDNESGWGSVPNNQDVDYFGLRVEMTPNTFLSLAAPLGSNIPSDEIVKHIQNGGKIGSPFLNISIPKEWLEDNPDNNLFLDLTAAVFAHEGRNRMLAVKEILGNIPVETHLFFDGYVKNRHLTPEIIKAMQNKLRSESGDNIVEGNLFGVLG